MANWRGTWSSGTAYSPGDSVSAGGVNYYCVTASTGQAPASSGNWIPQNIYTGPPAAGASLASPAFTGTPTAPTEGASSDNTGLATTAYADSAVAVETAARTTATTLLAPLAGKNTFSADQYFKSGRPWFDVIAFGADPTGAADSTPAFNAAIAAAIGLRTDTNVGFTASSTTVTDPSAVSGDNGLYITSPNFPAPGYAHITAVTPGVGYTAGLAATATLSAQTATVGTAAALTARTCLGPVNMPGGLYKITSDLIIRSVAGFHLMGAGADQCRIAPEGTGFTQAVIFIDGSLDGRYEGFAINGNGTEGTSAGTNPGIPSAIRLDWTTAASRSTSGNHFANIRIRVTNCVTGLDLSGTGTRQLDGTYMHDIVCTGSQVAGSWSGTGNWQSAYVFGNGSQGNNYDHIQIACGAADWNNGTTVNCSSLAVFGSQPGGNAIDFNLLQPTDQCTFENIQSQTSGQFLVCTAAGSPVPVSLRDIAFKGWTGGGYNAAWIYTGTSYGTWVLENVNYAGISPPTPPTISVAGGHGGNYGTPFVAIAVCQPSPPATGFTVGTGQSVVVIGYQDTTGGVGNNAVVHPFYAINAGVLWQQGLAAARPAASLYGEGFYWATDTTALSRSNGSAWTALLSQNSVVTAPDIQWFTSSGTWTKPAAPAPVTTEVYLLAGGGGGGSGRQGAVTLAAITGGAGGGGSGLVYRKFVSSDLGATVTVTVGAGGAGGAAVATTATNGAAGSAGTATSFGTVAYNAGGFGGGAGSTAASVGGSAGAGTAAGGAGGGDVVAGTAGTNSSAAPGASGGGGGGGLTAVPAASLGGTASYSQEGYSSNVGAAGVIDSTLPTAGTQPTVKGTPSCGGAGGCSSITTAAQAGATAYNGGGGGGGGASLTGSNAGAGGTGGPGFALVISYFQ